jgi:hypothetical protein
MMFGGLRDQMEEALQARDEDEWRRLFDIYRRSTELVEKKYPHLAALQRRLPGRLRNGDIERG